MQNKKGQEGITIGTLLLIVLGVVVVVVLIIGFTKGFGFIFGKQEILPLQQTQAIAKSCELSATNALAIDFCAELKMASKGNYVTCSYDAIKKTLSPDLQTKITCDPSMNDLLVQKCKDLKPGPTNSLTIYTSTKFGPIKDDNGCTVVHI
jgi:hypothetical protein